MCSQRQHRADRRNRVAVDWPNSFRSQGSRNGNLGDRKSTRLNSSHDQISYAVFCLKKKKKKRTAKTSTKSAAENKLRAPDFPPSIQQNGPDLDTQMARDIEKRRAPQCYIPDNKRAHARRLCHLCVCVLLVFSLWYHL